MKLFKSLLVAPATLGLLAPMSVTANELNLTEVSGYSSSEEVENISEFNSKDLAVTNSRVDGLEARMNNFEAGSFSETTAASFSANFYLGATDTDDGSSSADDFDDTLMGGYDFQIGLTTSFTGEDSLAVTIDSGNAGGAGYAEFAGDDTTDKLTVDGVSYTFPLGGATVFVGDNTDGSALFTTACAYGGPSNTLDDCGNVNAGITNGGAMAGASYDFSNGFTAAVGYAGPEGGIMTEESLDAYGVNVAYSADSYGVSLTYGSIDSNNGAATPIPDGEKDAYTAFNAYYSFDNGVSISGGYEFGDLGGEAETVDGVINYFVGISAPAGPGEIGGAVGTSGGQTEGSTEELMYEAYYSYPVNDGIGFTKNVPLDPDNTDYQEIQEWVADGNTIEDAE